MNLIDDFKEEKTCFYKGEQYSVRDNGAVCRLSRCNAKKRILDDKWTFGKEGNNGYLYIAGVQAHRIVATAFHGIPAKSEMVVDHMDTNKQNNRPENLRWVTREENILNNPNTVKKIEYMTGRKIDEVIKDPEILHAASASMKKTNWMRPVSKEEADNLKARQQYWISNDKNYSNGSMGEWVFSSYQRKKEEVLRNILRDTKNTAKHVYTPTSIPDAISDVSDDQAEDEEYFCASLTDNALQNWRIPTKFLCCPSLSEEQSLNEYFKHLEVDKIFDENKYGTSRITDFDFTTDRKSIIVALHLKDLPIAAWRLLKITFEKGKFYHQDMESFMEENGVRKYFALATGKEWTGGDVLEDFIR